MQQYWLIYNDTETSIKQLNEFIKNGIWKTSHKDHSENLQRIKKNDLLFTNVSDNKRHIRQIRKGKVLENPNDNKTLKIEWDINIYDVFFEVNELHSFGLNVIPKHEIFPLIKACFPELKHALASTENDTNLDSTGYKAQGVIGYIDVTTNEEQHNNNLVPLFQDYEIERDDYFCYTNEKINIERKKDNIFPSLLGYISHSGEENNFYKLCSFVNTDSLQDHFYSTNPNEKILDGLFYKEENEFGYLWKKASPSRKPLYVYSKTPDIFLFEPLTEKQTDADLISDNPAKVDDLGRDALMEILYDKINAIWTTWSSEENFTLLINGEWGSGKSSMLNYLKEYLKNGHWEIIEYNAWEHQHMSDQWWILINKISKHLTSNSYERTTRSHNFWKFRLKNRNTILLLFLIIIFLASSFIFTNILVSNTDNNRTPELIVSIIGIVATLFATIVGIVQNIFTRNVNISQLISNYTNDPYKPIKDRFKEVTKNKKVAVLIDDLDRCETKPTVELLEGIQNLFKLNKILYVIAADGNWISNCFDKKYKDFDTLGKEGISVGNQFLQKAFQLIVDVPKMGENERKKLWGKFLKVKSINEKMAQKDRSTSKEISTLEQVFDASTANNIEVRKDAAKKISEIVEDHILLDYTEYAPNNPREIKRLINHFSIKLESLTISGTAHNLSIEILIRYIIFSSKYPDYDKEIKQNRISLEKLKKDNDKINEIVGNELSDELIRQYL